MTSILKYGSRGQLKLEIAPGALVADCAGPVEVRGAESRSVVAAVEAPLDFPPIKQAVVPGDRVVLALAAGVPHAEQVVAAIVPALVEGGVAGEDIAVLQTQGDVDAGLADPRSRLPAELQQSVQLLTHNPAEQTQLSYLAADDQGEPIYMNRRMCEADFFIPIGCLQPSEAVHKNGSKEIWNETIYPTFGDRKRIDDLAPTGVAQSKGQLARRAKQIDEIAWQLGVQVTAQVVPAGDDRALEVFIGAPARVFRDGRELCRRAWMREIPRRAKLVISGISGRAAQQTWENVGRALEAALRVVADGGAVVICTELREPLGPALRQLAAAGDSEEVQQRLRKMHSSDAALARLLASELERVSVYLLSELDEDVVAPLGIAHVGDPADVARLASRAESCVLLGDGQYVVASVEARD